MVRLLAHRAVDAAGLGVEIARGGLEGDWGDWVGVSSDHIHLFIQYPPKYSVSFIAKRLKGMTSRILRQEFPELKKWCKKSLWAPSCYHGSVGHGWDVVEKYITGQDRKSCAKKII